MIDFDHLDYRPRLLVVMPVFNEQTAITQVIHDWFRELDSVVGDFVFLVIDDGSTDSTLALLNRLKGRIDARMEIISRPNRGHGQTCLQGYRIAVERGIPHVLQIDSDGQCDPVYFKKFWEIRERYEVIYGRRSRNDGYRRIIASHVLRGSLLLLLRVNCVDANVPYRLMDVRKCAVAFESIPADVFLANVALAVVLRKIPGIRHGTVPIRFLARIGGEPSVPFHRFAAKGFELFKQLKEMGA